MSDQHERRWPGADREAIYAGRARHDIPAGDWMLSDALLALVGAREHMVLGLGVHSGYAVVDRAMLRAQARGEGPLIYGSGPCWQMSVDSPANWGHWGAHVLRMCEVQPPIQMNRFYPQNLMTWVCRNVPDQYLPPSVLAWWKSQQGEVSDG